MWIRRLIYIVPLRWRSIFDRTRLDAELDEELRDHVARLMDAYRANGLTPDQGRRAALLAMGGIQQRKEECRDMRRVRLLTDLMQDVRYAARMLRRGPIFTVVAVLSLALGIGATTAIFSTLDALMFRPLPVKNPEQLVTFRWDDGTTGPASSFFSFDHTTFGQLRDQANVFTNVSGSWVVGRSNVMAHGTGVTPDPGPVFVCFVSGNYFQTIGITAINGRTLLPDDDRTPGGHPVVVISDAYWRRRFSAARDVVGRTITMSGTTFTILGVTPRGFTGDSTGTSVDLWVPFMMASQVMPEVPGGPSRFPVRIVARVKPDMPIQQAQAAAQVLYQQIRKVPRARLELRRMTTGLPSVQRDAYTQPFAIVMSVAGVVLLIACANVANLLLARSSARRQEMAVRLAIGAGRGRIARQLLTESVLLAVLGGGLGVIIAIWGTKVLASTVAAGPISLASQSAGLSLDVRLDARSLAVTAILCLFTGVLFGLAPAFRGSNVLPLPALTEHGAGASGLAKPFGLGKMLVISQVALSLLLVTGAGLFLRTLHNLERQELGFDRHRLLLVWTVPGQTGRQDAAVADLWRTVQERLGSLPGVVAASAFNGGLLNGSLPSPGNPIEQLRVEGRPPRTTTLQGGRTFVAPRFFETIGVPMVAGREFTERDNESAPRVIVINEAMARVYFGNENPIGARVGLPGSTDTPFEIVGVVKDFVRGTPRGIFQPELAMYFPYRDRDALNRGAQSRLRVMLAVVRTAGDPRELATVVRRELREIDPNLAVIRINTIDDQLEDVLVQERLVAMLSGFFGALAILLAMLGLYGVIAYAVARRVGEIGIRLALGATPGGVVAMIVKEGVLLVAAGIAIGLPMTLGASRLVETRLFGVGSADPATIAAAAVTMVAVALLGAFLPALRASRIEPVVALRSE